MAQPQESLQTFTLVRHISRMRSTAMISPCCSVGRFTACKMMTIITSPACGIPAAPTLASKAVKENREYLAELAVDAILNVAEKTDGGYRVDLDDIVVEKKPGESIMGTKVVEGIAIDKEMIHSGAR